MAEEMLSVQYWLTIKKEVRDKLVDIFNIPRSGGSLVENTSGSWKVLSDGHLSKDLSAINIKSLQKELNTDSEDFYKMLKAITIKLTQNEETTTNEGADSSGNGNEKIAPILPEKVLPISEKKHGVNSRPTDVPTSN